MSNTMSVADYVRQTAALREAFDTFVQGLAIDWKGRATGYGFNYTLRHRDADGGIEVTFLYGEDYDEIPTGAVIVYDLATDNKTAFAPIPALDDLTATVTTYLATRS